MDEKDSPSRQRRTGLRRAAGVGGLAAAGLLVVACSGGGPHPSGAGTSPAPGRVQQLDSFAQCMRSHGEPAFYFSSSASNPGASSAVQVLSIMGYYVPGVNPRTAQFATAMNVCKHLLPGGGPQPVTPQQLDRQVKFAACLRAHGYPGYPDPDVQNGRPIQQPLPSSIDTSSPQFQAAEKTCSTGS